MSENKENLQINDILALLQKANKTLESTVTVPSLNKDLPVKPLGALHTKNILKSTMNGPFTQNQFTLVSYQILKDVLGPDASQLNVLDKAIVLLQLRSKNINDVLEVELTAQGVEEPLKHKVTLTKHIAKVLKKIEPVLPTTVELENYVITLNLPSIEEEFLFENNLYRSKLANVKEDDKNAMRGLIAPLFIYQISQYVKSVNVEGREIDVTKMNANDRLAIVESLSATALSGIIKKIDEVYGANINKVTELTVTSDGVKYSGSIEIGAGLFIVS